MTSVQREDRGPVAVVFHTSLIGGPVRSLGDEIRWLSGIGPVDIAIPSGDEADPVYRELGGDLVSLPYSIVSSPDERGRRFGILGRFIREVRMFRSWFRSRGTSLVLTVTTALPSVVMAARMERIPVVIYAAEIPPREGRDGERKVIGSIKQLAVRGLIWLQSRFADQVIVCSPGVSSEISKPERAIVHYPPIDPGECQGDGSLFRRRFGIDDGAPLVVCIGSISRARGQHVLLASVARLLGRFPEMKVVINGAPFPRRPDLEYSAELDSLISRLGLGGVVIRTERTDPLGDLLSAADVVVNPATTYNEGFGRVAFEAGLAGTPMVASGRGVLPELHDDGETILLVPPSDVDALADGIARLIDDPELGRKVAAGSANLARELASPASSLAAFQEAIGRARSAGMRDS